MIDSYIYVIVALLPIVSLSVIFEVNPYHALVMRAILGALAALVYAILGGADVALTEALVGTMLAITLYVVAVRSSLVMRLGILAFKEEKELDLEIIINNIRKILNKHHLRLELVEYDHAQALTEALNTKEVHATCHISSTLASQTQVSDLEANSYQLLIRVNRLVEIMQNELDLSNLVLTNVNKLKEEDNH